MQHQAKYFILPHTLKVNELPKHNHGIPGYNYGETNSGSYKLNLDSSGILRLYDLNWSRAWGSDNSALTESLGGHRSWTLGINGSTPTTEQGNNESLE